MSQLVPPMSSEITLSLAGLGRDVLTAYHAGRQDRTGAAKRAVSSTASGAGDAAARLHDLQLASMPIWARSSRCGVHIVADRALQIGIERGHHRALVLAKRGVDVARERDVQCRAASHDDLTRALFVRRVAERKQITDRDRGDVLHASSFSTGVAHGLSSSGLTTEPSAASRSGIAKRRRRGARNAGVSGSRKRSYRCERLWRPISSASSKPSVARRPVTAPFAGSAH